MDKTILLILVGLFFMAKHVDAVCCDAIKSEVDKKIKANYTLCASWNTLPQNCCKDIANEAKKYMDAYEALCSNTVCLAPKALGMESGKIPDNAITASSSYDSRYKPANGRLNKVIGSCAWATTSAGKSNSWFQIDLGEFATVTGIATQGSCQAYAIWTTSYTVSYSTNGKKWTAYKESGGKTKMFVFCQLHFVCTKNGFFKPIETKHLLSATHSNIHFKLGISVFGHNLGKIILH